jgi:hypothetical protein
VSLSLSGDIAVGDAGQALPHHHRLDGIFRNINTNLLTEGTNPQGVT